MNTSHPNASAAAQKYIGTVAPLKALGWGIDGVVFASPSATTAVKVHSRIDGFEKELAAYERLKIYGVSEFEGFAVPRLVGSDPRLRIIEMSIVTPPFLLDFAAATLDDDKNFPEDVLEDWWSRVRDDFGADFDQAQSVFWGLVHKFGIYYWDIRPRNLQMRR